MNNSPARYRHDQALKALAPAVDFSALARLEKRAANLAVRLCNEPVKNGEAMQRKIENELAALLPGVAGVFVNWDPRGHALKINNPPAGMFRDMGGDGIICPSIPRYRVPAVAEIKEATAAKTAGAPSPE